MLPALLALQLWGPLAATQEGATFSLGLLTPGSDAFWIVAGGHGGWFSWPVVSFCWEAFLP